MAGFIVFVMFVLGTGAFIALIIRADQKDEQSYKDWYEHPDQIWNRWKER